MDVGNLLKLHEADLISYLKRGIQLLIEHWQHDRAAAEKAVLDAQAQLNAARAANDAKAAGKGA